MRGLGVSRSTSLQVGTSIRIRCRRNKLLIDKPKLLFLLCALISPSRYLKVGKVRNKLQERDIYTLRTYVHLTWQADSYYLGRATRAKRERPLSAIYILHIRTYRAYNIIRFAFILAVACFAEWHTYLPRYVYNALGRDLLVAPFRFRSLCPIIHIPLKDQGSSWGRCRMMSTCVFPYCSIAPNKVKKLLLRST